MYNRLTPTRRTPPSARRGYLIGDASGTYGGTTYGTGGTSAGNGTNYTGYAQTGLAIVNTLTGGGNATDQKRQARAQWVGQQANNGSGTAGAMALAATANVSGNEAAYWRTVAAQLTPQARALAQASTTFAATGGWPVNHPDFDTDRYLDANGAVHQIIAGEVMAATGRPPATPTSTYTPPGYTPTYTPPGYTPTYRPASTLFTPTNLLIGGALVAGFALTRKPRRRS